MAYFTQYSSSPPSERFIVSQPSSPAQPATFDDVDDFLSSDLDISFASTMSINSAPASPTATAGCDLFLDSTCKMETSSTNITQRAPPTKRSNNVFGPPSSPTRPFGQDLSNTLLSSSPSLNLKDSTRPRSKTALPPIQRPLFATQKSSSQAVNLRARAPLPGSWLHVPTPSSRTNTRVKRNGAIFSQSPDPVPSGPIYSDVEMKSPGQSGLSSLVPSSPFVPQSAGKSDFSALFFHPSSPENYSSPLGARQSVDGVPRRKRRSADPEPSEDDTQHAGVGLTNNILSSSPPPSPSHKRPKPMSFGRTVSLGGQGTLFSTKYQQQLDAPQPLVKKGVPKRPTLSAVLPLNNRASSASSVPIEKPLISAPPTRRAFSQVLTSRACASSSPAHNLGEDSFELTEEEADASFDMNSPAHRSLIARKENVGRLGHHMPSPLVTGKPVPGLPGFGDCEADGKILPCHKVREDGLMRITPKTLHDLIQGHYSMQIGSYIVIDCRFDYEHNGGHVSGSINLNTNDAIDEYLLGERKPAPSRSGDKNGKKTILVFHCEFSVKRAPTLRPLFSSSAKHLRSKDRSMNGHVYPNIHYPELYILEGGYSSYFNRFSDYCFPSAYVRMDDPAYQRARATELNDFRRGIRARSFTYGEQQRLTGQQQQQQSASQPTRPIDTDAGSVIGLGKGYNLSFAAANAAYGRRGGHLTSNGTGTLSTLQEDGDSSCTSEPDPADSPCPPSNRVKFTVMAAGQKPRGMQRALTTALISARN
ncbi:uncharacterized protein EI90DRAFT_3018747 [Cantharellus anzutake]|uniref:uncharacterized protein n=1 Tax=Cantharellus anzutake TaxID=1750568 RepID=UPI001907AA94|nr:uncharacterized protein EI90DRAFT_3018747 [Cantharellus anzutake]KAF8326000.1 hypothetical protein EI90DRAFT_3018747 [Cantharellus anzutake]